ncbi:MAG: hypothetical protein GY803_11850 [Chloroflexi bacterium]|nr:hypothetical protein [Chloroflexota bacterium]
MMQSKENATPIPGILATIAAGFDITAKQFWLTLIPVLLDSFLWLGPRLSFRLLVERAAAFLGREAATTGLDMSILLELAPRTNLFTSLSVPLLGVPALMSGIAPEKTPLPTAVTELESVWLWLALFVLFSLVGLLLTAVYLAQTAYVVRRREGDRFYTAVFLKQIGWLWLQLAALGISFFVAATVVYMPLVIVGAVISILSQGLASIIILMGPVVLMWLLIYLSLTPHGLALHGRPLWRAMIESLQLIRFYMLPALSLLLLIFMIGQALDWALLLADDGSWLTWVSIWGHAFVSTSLLAATFIFYRDRHAALFEKKQT